MVPACNPKKCPEMRKRMDRHKKDYHTKTPPISVNNKAGQSSFDCIDVLKLDQNATVSKNVDKGNPEARSEIPLKNSETQNILVPKRNFYREHLQDVVLKWFLGIPVLFNTDNTMKLKRLKMVHDLGNTIANYASDVDKADYNDKIKHDIDDCIENLAMWCSNVKVEKNEFNGNLCRSLRERIGKVNDKWLNAKHGVIDSDNDSTFDILKVSNNNVSAVENEIRDWVEFELVSEKQSNVDKQAIAAIFINRLMPLIKSKRCENNCFKVEIVNTLDEMSESLNLIKDKVVHAHTLAIDLVNRVINVNRGNKNNPIVMIQAKKNHDEKNENEGRSEDIVKIPSNESEDTIIQITDILTGGTDSDTKIQEAFDAENKTNITQIDITSEEEETSSKKTVVTYVRHPLNQNSSFNLAQQYLSDSLIVLTSENELLRSFDKNEPLTSTPLMTAPRKDIPTLNPEEKVYLAKIVEVLRPWLETVDMTFETTEEQFFKESIANDMAGDIKDLAKQIQMGQIQDRITIEQYEGLLNYVILRAIFKYGLLTPPVTFTTPQVADLREKIKDLGMEVDLTNPQHGNRQKWSNFKFRSENPVTANQVTPVYKANALEILEDNISVWMNEQPSEIYKDQDRKRRNEQLREVATKIQKKIENKKENEVKKDLVKWLKKILVSKAKKDADNLAADLKDRIINLPTDESLDRRMQKRNRAIAGDDTDLPPQRYNDVNEAPDAQLKEFIEKFMEHNYDVDDSLVKSALGNILLQELLKLNPVLRTEGSNIGAHEEFNPEKFRMELEYIKEISDWLKNIPFYPLVGLGNDRVEFVNGIAKNIAVVEQERLRDPGKMEYDKILFSEIYEYMVQLPLRSQDMPNLTTCINQLIQRIIRHRSTLHSPVANQNPSQPIKNEQDFAQFIEEFVNIRAKDIGDDKLKLEAYLARLLKEIQRMINEKAESDVLTKSDLYNRLVDVPVPGKESMKRFSIGLGYVQEIAEWLHNFPLIPLTNQEENIIRIKMITDLAEKMAEYDLKIVDDPDDVQANEDLDDYIIKWINNLKLDTSKAIVVPILISQLKRRMEKVKIKSEQKLNLNTDVAQDVRTSNSQKRASGSSCKNCCSSNEKCYKMSKTGKSEDPGDLIVEAIENWCNDLPISEENDEATKAAKEKVATDIFQKVGLLNSDPQAANDDMLYRDMLSDEVEAELQELTESYPYLSQIIHELKDSLLNTVMDAKEVIKDISAGENYKQALENTIDSSLPNPNHISSQNDPGFELYKSRMAMLWLLENYDYAIDFNSLKYKKRLNEDIDMFADEAQKRNILPLEKYEMFNEAFSAMYKQNPPQETSIIEEVEYVKTKCEIDAWSKELPLQKSSGYQELLEREQILALLSKKLLDIELSKSPDANEQMRKGITKWLKRLPLLPGEDEDIDQYVDKLICNLKATAKVRKCKRKTESNKDAVIKEYVEDAKSNKAKTEKDITQFDVPQVARKGNTSQIAGPSGVRPKPNYDSTAPRKKAGDLITAAIETWCNQLPLIAHGSEDQRIIDTIRDETILKMYQLLSDLHTDPNILNSEGLYEHHLNIEIERLLSELPAYSEAQQMRNARRARIINELKAVRPLIKDEFDREGYKQDLKHAMSSFLDETSKPIKFVVNDNSKQAIIDNFIELRYHKGEFEEQQLYKSKIDDVVAEVIKNNKGNTNVDPLLTRNQLICEMSKVRPPNESALTDEVQEIRMKDKIAQLFRGIKIPKGDEEKATYNEQIKLLLSKKLIDIERNGRNSSNDDKMKTEIAKALKKLGAKINSDRIDDFVQNLKETEDARKALPARKDDKCGCGPNQSSQKSRNIPLGPSLVMRSPENSIQHPHAHHERSFLPQPQVPQAPMFQPPMHVEPPIFYPQSPKSASQFQRPTPPPRPTSPVQRQSSHMPRFESHAPTAPPELMTAPAYRPVTQNPPDIAPPYLPAPPPMTSVPALRQTSGLAPYAQTQASRTYSQHIPRPDFGLPCCQAYRQPEPAPPVMDEGEVHFNVPVEENNGTRSTARVPESTKVRGDSSCSCQQICSDNTNLERDIFDDCECRSDKKKKNCQGVCKADKAEYCDECQNDHDCDFDVPMMPYPPMYPYLMPGFMFFN